MLGSQGAVGRYDGWVREMHVFRFEKAEDKVTKQGGAQPNNDTLGVGSTMGNVR